MTLTQVFHTGLSYLIIIQVHYNQAWSISSSTVVALFNQLITPWEVKNLLLEFTVPLSLNQMIKEAPYREKKALFFVTFDFRSLTRSAVSRVFANQRGENWIFGQWAGAETSAPGSASSSDVIQ